MVGFFLLGSAVLSSWPGGDCSSGSLGRGRWRIVLACFSLIKVPFGTALGIYTMWVLLPAASEEEYRQIARVA